jgi:EF hand
MRSSWKGLLVAVAAAVALPPLAAVAQDELRRDYSPERIAFDAADTDGSGRVSLPELARDAAHGFAALDKDGDGKLRP